MVPVPRQGQQVGGLDGKAPLPLPLAPIQLLLGRDALLEVFMRLSPRFVARCAAVCRQVCARRACARVRALYPRHFCGRGPWTPRTTTC
jgi:hypothetical protein